MVFRVFILWLHLVGVAVWFGGLVYQLLVVNPSLNRATSVREQLRLGLRLERRFGRVLWIAVGLVLLTGFYNVMNLLYTITLAGGALPPTFTRILGMKLLLVGIMIILQAVQQLGVRPKRIALFQALLPEAIKLPAPLLALNRLSRFLQSGTIFLAGVVILLALLWRG